MKKFENQSFIVGLGSVAGFIDVFGFTELNGLLPAYVTGTLIFLAINLAHGQYHIILKLAALPIVAILCLIPFGLRTLRAPGAQTAASATESGGHDSQADGAGPTDRNTIDTGRPA